MVDTPSKLILWDCSHLRRLAPCLSSVYLPAISLSRSSASSARFGTRLLGRSEGYTSPLVGSLEYQLSQEKHILRPESTIQPILLLNAVEGIMQSTPYEESRRRGTHAPSRLSITACLRCREQKVSHCQFHHQMEKFAESVSSIAKV